MLYLVRHGRTAANAGGRLQGRLDLPIDEVGLLAADLVDRLVCSPALRTRQTAEVFGVVPELDDRWLELDYGDFDGIPMAQVPRDQWNRWVSDVDFRPPNGETLRELGERVHAACDELREAARDQEVVVVSHATPIKAAMAWALGVGVGISWRSHIDQASVTKILIRANGPALNAFNVLPPA